MSRRMVARGDDEKVTSPSGGADAAATRKGVPAQPDIGAAAAVAVAGANSSSEENSDDEGGASINTSSGTSANSDGDSDDSSGGGGGDLMSSLAASIRQALQVKATGGKGTSHRAQPAHGRRPGKAAAAGTAAAAAANAGGKGSAGADQEDEAALLVRQQAQATWAPQILLPKAKAPTREVHRTEITVRAA